MSSQGRARNLRNNCLGLDLDLPSLVQQRLDDDHGRCGPGAAHHLAVRASDCLAVRDVRDEHPRAHHLVDRRAGIAQRGGNDLEAAFRLDIWIRVDRSVRRHGRGPGHEHAVAGAQGAAEADRLLERGPGADPAALVQGRLKGSSSSCSKRSWTADCSSLASALSRSCAALSVTLTTRTRRSVVCSAYRPAGSFPVMRAAEVRISLAASSWPCVRSHWARRAAATSTRCVFGLTKRGAISRAGRGWNIAAMPFGRRSERSLRIALRGPTMISTPVVKRVTTTTATIASSIFP